MPKAKYFEQSLSAWITESGNQGLLLVCTFQMWVETCGLMHWEHHRQPVLLAAKGMLRREKAKLVNQLRGRWVWQSFGSNVGVSLCFWKIKKKKNVRKCIHVEQVRNFDLDEQRVVVGFFWDNVSFQYAMEDKFSPSLGQDSSFYRLSSLKQLHCSCIIPLMITNQVRLLSFIVDLFWRLICRIQSALPLCQDLGHIFLFNLCIILWKLSWRLHKRRIGRDMYLSACRTMCLITNTHTLANCPCF